MTIGSNAIEFRRVRKRFVEPDGGINWIETWQVRTKDILGLSLGSWSSWKDIEVEGLIYVDESGNQITP